MAVLEGNEALFIEKITPAGGASTPTWVGKHMDLNCTAVGKILLAHVPEEQIDALILCHGLPKHNENVSVAPRRFKDELRRVRKLGYAIDDEENEIGYRAVAAPILSRSCDNAAISVAGRSEDVTSDNITDLIRKLKNIAFHVVDALDGERAGLWAPRSRIGCPTLCWDVECLTWICLPQRLIDPDSVQSIYCPRFRSLSLIKHFCCTLQVDAACVRFPAWGQVATGSLGGTVLDANGAAVPGAAVTAKNDATGVELEDPFFRCRPLCFCRPRNRLV